MSPLITRVLLILAALMIGLTAWEYAKADGVMVGADCTISWTAPTIGGPVQGYNVYIGSTATTKAKAGTTPATSISCTALDTPPAGGQRYAHITAYNIAGESAASATVPFVVVNAPPGIPGGVGVAPKP